MKNQLPLCVQTAFINTISGDLRSPKDNTLTLAYAEHGYRFGITASLDGRIKVAYATYCDSPMNATSLTDLFGEENVQTIEQRLTEWVSFWNERLNPTKEEPTSQTEATEEPKAKKPLVEVLFRKEEDGQILCVFANLFWANPRTDLLQIECYSHIGQHSTTDYSYITDSTTEASPSEYADLLAEVSRIYSDCELKTVRNLPSGKWYSDHIISYVNYRGEKSTYAPYLIAPNKREAMKKLVRDDAVDFSHHAHEIGDLYELNRISNHFYELGKRYGLLREFHENGIC